MERGVAMSNGGVATEERTGLISRQDYKGGVAMQKRGVACPQTKRGYAKKGVVTQRRRGYRGKRAWLRPYLCVTLMTSRARGPAPCAFPANRSAAAATSAGS